jgi:hypothetical protein
LRTEWGCCIIGISRTKRNEVKFQQFPFVVEKNAKQLSAKKRLQAKL